MSKVAVVCIAIALVGPRAAAQNTGGAGRFPDREPGPIEVILHRASPGLDGAPRLPFYSTAGIQLPSGDGAFSAPPVWHAVAGGLAAKVIVDGLLIEMAGDVFHALPSLLFIDPVITAAGVHIGNDTRGNFFLDALASYGSFYLLTTLFYGEFMPAGEFEDPTSYTDFFYSMGIQLVLTVMTERTIAQRPARSR